MSCTSDSACVLQTAHVAFTAEQLAAAISQAWSLNACAATGAAFVQALTEFRQECVWQAFCGPKLHGLNVKAQLREAFNKAQVEASAARGSVTKPPSSPPNAGAAPQIGASAANGSTSSANKSAGKESGQKSLSLSGPTQTS